MAQRNLGSEKLQRPTVAVFADGQNVCLKKYGSTIIDFVNSLGDIPFLYAYHHWRAIPKETEHKLQLQGWQCVDVAVKTRNELDNRLMSDFARLSIHWMPDILVLVTGDKDFSPLIRACQMSERRVIVIGRHNNVSQRLQKLNPKDIFFVEDLQKFSKEAA
ncbi:NYN domain-containing protein [Nodosilinea sp. FACHB-131]|uniref:NYN domain-containing protein n=1 Tax=Cyanophyceae TaxID=3028117 RepID=UPI001686602D|nr:NYN domain-containing protein [Nodosilinea sp. FACHB-131]MBD1875338.1 NYN domain-containing protein [Nodosilinea sp. FACHB-131]